MSKRKLEETNNDNFMTTMTFAQGVSRMGCDCCDEDCQAPRQPLNEEQEYWMKAVEQYNKTHLPRTQDRTLKCRHTVGSDDKNNAAIMSIWEWTLPVDAEPLLEYGDSTRLVWVKRLPVGSMLQTIGPGIVGSQSEQNQRINLPWKSGEVYLLPRNKESKAVGFVHKYAKSEIAPAKDSVDSQTTSQNKAEHETTGPAVLVIVKLSKQSYQVNTDEVNEDAKYLVTECKTIEESVVDKQQDYHHLLNAKDTASMISRIKQLMFGQ